MNTLLHGRPSEDEVDDRDPANRRPDRRPDPRNDARNDSRNYRFDRDDRNEAPESRDREITLGTTMVLGIFFALAVLCAAFFGFGYSTGRQSALSAAGVAQAGSSTTFGGFKPAPGSPAGSLGAGAQLANQTVTVPFTPMSPQAVAPLPPRSTQSLLQTLPKDTPAELAAAETPARPLPRPDPRTEPAPAPAAAAPAAAGQSMVQVAAVSHQEDADLLVTTLKRRGYAVAVHREPADTLMHVQIGPFSSRKEAESMRQRLLADGFNAIVK